MFQVIFREGQKRWQLQFCVEVQSHGTLVYLQSFSICKSKEVSSLLYVCLPFNWRSCSYMREIIWGLNRWMNEAIVVTGTLHLLGQGVLFYLFVYLND